MALARIRLHCQRYVSKCWYESELVERIIIEKLLPENVHLLSFLVSFGPLILAQVMANLTDKSKRSIFYPFHKDGWKTMSRYAYKPSTATKNY